MKNTSHCLSRWRVRALLFCTAGLLLSACGAGNQGGLSNGPQIAALAVVSPAPVVQTGSIEPAAPESPPEAAMPAAIASRTAAALPAPAIPPAASDAARSTCKFGGCSFH